MSNLFDRFNALRLTLRGRGGHLREVLGSLRRALRDVGLRVEEGPGGGLSVASGAHVELFLAAELREGLRDVEVWWTGGALSLGGERFRGKKPSPLGKLEGSRPEELLSGLFGLLCPTVVVASNGHGEDAIAAAFMEFFRRSFPFVRVLAFPIVGDGLALSERGFEVVSPLRPMPSGGLIKYSLRALYMDLKAGLLGLLLDQFRAMRDLSSGNKVLVCVGDVFLLAFVGLASGLKPVLVSTAKTVRLRGFYPFEVGVLRSMSGLVLTRDPESASFLRGRGVEALYLGNPVMDVLGEMPIPRGVPSQSCGVLLLPGSRSSAYQDMGLLLDVASRMVDDGFGGRFYCLVSRGLNLSAMLQGAIERGFKVLQVGERPCLCKGKTAVELWSGGLEHLVRRCSLVVGLGGTANQICAGFGLPVVSVDDKARRVQKRLLGEAEVLVKRDAAEMAKVALSVLRDPILYSHMSLSGMSNMGSPGCFRGMVDVFRSCGLGLLERMWVALSSASDETLAEGRRRP